ncbi:hypothetical protein [Zhihengliuella flava]|uniref:Uncharacterized protein n=1 Tax=Zhihengliuella flava TaxID=1285193 RepID=A0A931GDR3_9MICC|nr:hypothetical protein [Zhihengliuella flava]MBG6083240.1 hypothetical protein [Zhihengliuella flava]
MKRVPGSRHYRALPGGIKQLAADPKVAGRACNDAAMDLAGNANSVGDSTYASAPAIVTGGWANDRRAGAAVRETTKHWRDWRDGVLLRVARSMEVRG